MGVTGKHIASHYARAFRQLEISWGDTLRHLDKASPMPASTRAPLSFRLVRVTGLCTLHVVHHIHRDTIGQHHVTRSLP